MVNYVYPTFDAPKIPRSLEPAYVAAGIAGTITKNGGPKTAVKQIMLAC
jgi:hypothetical protein